jgi:hypothetical protein
MTLDVLQLGPLSELSVVTKGRGPGPQVGVVFAHLSEQAA